MSTHPLRQIPVEEYLAGEQTSESKHEYGGGVVYTMAGDCNAHNLIASNLLGALHARLRGRTCRAYNSDTKIRVQLLSGQRFYHPDSRARSQSIILRWIFQVAVS